MKLQIGVPDYPHTGGLESAVIRGRKAGRDLRIMVVSIEDMKAKRKELPHLCGFPVRIAFDPLGKRVWLHPSPDGEYELDINPGEPETVGAKPAAAKPPLDGTIKMPGKRDLPR